MPQPSSSRPGSPRLGADRRWLAAAVEPQLEAQPGEPVAALLGLADPGLELDLAERPELQGEIVARRGGLAVDRDLPAPACAHPGPGQLRHARRDGDVVAVEIAIADAGGR